MLAIKKLYPQTKDTHNRKKKTYRNKMQTNGHIAAINRKWNNREIEQQAYILQQAAEKTI